MTITAFVIGCLVPSDLYIKLILAYIGSLFLFYILSQKRFFAILEQFLRKQKLAKEYMVDL